MLLPLASSYLAGTVDSIAGQQCSLSDLISLLRWSILNLYNLPIFFRECSGLGKQREGLQNQGKPGV